MLLEAIQNLSTDLGKQRRDSPQNISQTLDALLELLSLWHLTGNGESGRGVLAKVGAALTTARLRFQELSLNSDLVRIKPSEIRDRWPPKASMASNAACVLDERIKLAIKLAHNLKKTHSSNEIASSLFLRSYPFNVDVIEDNHGVNSYISKY
ncbi:hypothetical protein GNI_067000 [Gregarina niphandrodes]|uniref:Uncharacterized protein n=1 Tax=Gregarina niphandrodes TaxID=110365 RepID=A0A023B7R6_GRENI|nr:hypothetical protein GNI_067000 [Gregarina niphandrodes]EZG67657.1 hypothetical protein GNI_067000 [Gregarina niphandrodes]|eukprot:XP_011130175.1 hypothetical protein GNI_067000 [Gregarina niphandrodes]